MVTSLPAAVTAFGVRARNPASHELRCGIASAHLSTDCPWLWSLTGTEKVLRPRTIFRFTIPESTPSAPWISTAKTPRSPRTPRERRDWGLLFAADRCTRTSSFGRNWFCCRCSSTDAGQRSEASAIFAV